MKETAEDIFKRLKEGKGSVLVTVVDDKGSAPRGAGAMMAVGEDGRISGTIGGGMLEFRATELAQEHLKNGTGELREYRLTKDQVAGLGMVCGGDVDVLFTYIAPTEENRAVFARMCDNISRHKPGWIMLPLDGSGAGFYDGKNAFGAMAEAEMGHIGDADKSIIEADNGRFYVEKLKNTSRVFVCGGGHLAQELVPLLAHLGFRCIVTDDRAEFSTKELFPDAEEVHTCAFTDMAYDVQPEDYVIAVTRGHMGDFEVQEFALRTPAYYIGVVGSRSKIATVNAKLKADGFTDADIARITAPIGIEIKSETPAEIAVSIAGQLIQKRAEMDI